MTSIFTIFNSLALDCLDEGQSVPIYKNSPTCCDGLVFEKPDTSNVGFSGKCVKSTFRSPSQEKQTLKKIETKKTLFQQPSF